LFSDTYEEINAPEAAAEKIVMPVATKAYRRFLKEDEKDRLMGLFQSVYYASDTLENPHRFNDAIAQTLKAILVSPHFLYRAEEEPRVKGVYLLSNFELATRLSYFLWSSMPDQELFSLAYLGKLQDTLVLEAQVKRMVVDPKARRRGGSGARDCLGVAKLVEEQQIVDPDPFPGFDMAIRRALSRETVEYFYYVLTDSGKMLELINRNYTFVNEELA